jgi:hypothetical protein
MSGFYENQLYKSYKFCLFYNIICDMKKFLVITTINAPTKAIHEFLRILWDEWKIIIVWDRKWPFTYLEDDKIIFLDIETQYKLYPTLASLIPEKHYSRKNIWYYHAITLWADFIAETDDDNIPYDFFPQFIDKKEIETDIIEVNWSINIYSHFTDKHIWPRWLDLTKIKNKVSSENIKRWIVKPYIQQSLADKDPDVDAIYRLTIYDEVYFDKNKSIALGKFAVSPFNTQNTYRHKESFPLLFIPTTVESRICDIRKSYIAQKWIQSIWWSVMFRSPTVYQERNEHNLQNDFNEEIPLYVQTWELISAINSIDITWDIIQDVKNIYQILINKWFLENKEQYVLDEFLNIFNPSQHDDVW